MASSILDAKALAELDGELLPLLDGIVAFPLSAAAARKFAATAMSPASLKAFRLLGCQPHPPPLLQLPAEKPSTAKPS